MQLKLIALMALVPFIMAYPAENAAKREAGAVNHHIARAALPVEGDSKEKTGKVTRKEFNALKKDPLSLKESLGLTEKEADEKYRKIRDNIKKGTPFEDSGSTETESESGETKEEGGETKEEGSETREEGGETKEEGSETKEEGGETKEEGGETKGEGGKKKEEKKNDE